MYNKRLKIHWGRMGWTAAFVLIAALFITGAAFAESGEPEPTEPPQEIKQASAEEAPAADENITAPDSEIPPPPAEEAPAAEENTTPPDSETPPPPAEEGAAAAEIEGEEAASAEGSSAEVVEAAAESGALLVDESGEELDLASQETAELLASGDPYYWVGTKKYAFVSNYDDCPPDAYECYEVADPIGAALLHMDTTTGLPSNRLLYVESGTYDGFTIDGEGSILSLLKGVIGVDGSEATTITSDTFITGTVSGFTLQGFTFSSGAGLTFLENSGTINIKDVVVENSDNVFGIEVWNHSGAINLDSVEASSNGYSGVSLQNYYGTSPITVTNSVFNNNGSSGTGYLKGLEIYSFGTVTLNGVAAQNNNGDGIDVWDYGTLKIKHAFLDKNTSDDVEGWGKGLNAYASGKGTAYLEDVRANDNDYGILIQGGSLKAKDVEANRSLEGTGLYFYSEDGSSRVEYGTFNDNYYDGLYIENKAAIYLNSIQASGNGANGLYLDNAFCISSDVCIGSGSVTLTSPKSGGWQLANGFMGNGGTGVYIQSRGAVTVTNADMMENGGFGLEIDNTYGNGGVTLNVTLKNWVNAINDNSDGGIVIQSNGAVKLSNTEAVSNQSNGIEVITLGNIELAYTNASNNLGWGANLNNSGSALPRTVKFTDCWFNDNQGDGLNVLSSGAISVKGMDASYNEQYGAYLDNREGVGGVTVTTTSTWTRNNFDGNTLSGLNILSAGAISVKGMDAYYNEQYGAYLDNHEGVGGVTVTTSSTWTENNFYGNTFSGLYILSAGAVSMKNISASWNGENGIYVDNTSGSSPVTYQSTGGDFWLSNNGSVGLNILSNGNVTLNNQYGLYSNNNGGDYGIYINNSSSSTPRYVKLINVAASNNGNGTVGEGLRVISSGYIYAKSLTADGNQENGANFSSTAGISITGGYFWSNGVTGLTARTNGSITWKFGSAEGNGGTGASLINAAGSGSVTVAGSNKDQMWFGDNDSSGLIIESNGQITLQYANAYDNGADGFTLYNFFSPLNKNVNVAEVGMDNNQGNGLYVLSRGAISVKGIYAYSNGQFGAYLDNREGVGGVTVTTTSTWTGNNFYGNTSSGLHILSAGAVSMKNISASGNGANGIYVDNRDGTSGTSPVTYQSTGSAFYLTDNVFVGLNILSNGNVTLNNQYGLYSNYNHGYYGIYIDNSSSSTPRYVKLINVAASNNDNSTVGDGIYVNSSGYIYAKSLTADGNHGYGANLSSNSGAVTITGSNYFRDNGASGLRAIAHDGSISFSNAVSRRNGNYGVYLDAANGNITVTSVTAADNNWTGVCLDGNGNFTINKVTAFNNGLGDGGGLSLTDDGLSIYTENAASAVSIKNSVFMANLNGNGIEIDHPTLGFWPYLYNVYYLGNGETNLYVHQ